MNKLAIGLTGLTFLIASPAMSADIRMPAKAPLAPAPVAAYNWTGCYVGGGFGYGMYDQESRVVDKYYGFTSMENDNGGRGWLGTVQVGCDFQIGSQFVIGAFADYDWSGIKGNMSIPTLGLVGEEKLKNSWAVGGRLGWVPWTSTQLLVFVSGGYSQARFNQVNFVDVEGFPEDVFLAKHTYKGWFIGTGYEYGFAWLPIQGLFWKTEYRFYDFRRDSVALFETGCSCEPFANLENRKFVQTIRSEIVWRFNFGNWGAPVAARY